MKFPAHTASKIVKNPSDATNMRKANHFRYTIRAFVGHRAANRASGYRLGLLLGDDLAHLRLRPPGDRCNLCGGQAGGVHGEDHLLDAFLLTFLMFKQFFLRDIRQVDPKFNVGITLLFGPGLLVGFEVGGFQALVIDIGGDHVQVVGIFDEVGPLVHHGHEFMLLLVKLCEFDEKILDVFEQVFARLSVHRLMGGKVAGVLCEIEIQDTDEVGRTQLRVVVALLYPCRIVAAHIELYALVKPFLLTDLQLHDEFATVLIGSLHIQNARLACGDRWEKIGILDGHAHHTVGAISIQNRIQKRDEGLRLVGIAKDLVEGYVVCNVGKLHDAHDFRGKDKDLCFSGFDQ
jgi:hypothetical protein